MKKIYLYLLLLFVLPSLHSQVKVFIDIPKNAWDYTEKAAAWVYYTTRESNLIDTSVYVYNGKKVYWKYYSAWQGPWPNPDSVILFTFSVATIVGRGSTRQAKFTTIVPTRDSTKWIWIADNYIAVGDTITKPRLDTLKSTTDSTFRKTTWLCYTKFQDHNASASSVGKGKFERWSFENGALTLTIWLEKVLGDPTSRKGVDQRAILHFQFKEEPRSDWVEKFDN
jgi:hypothetical protein